MEQSDLGLQCLSGPVSVLQIKRGNRDNLGKFFHKSIFCDPSLEPSHRDGSNDGSQHMFSLRNKKNYL